MPRPAKGESSGGDAKRERLYEIFNSAPQAFLGRLGAGLERQELAGPPVSREDANQRAASWRLLHLCSLGITPEPEDVEAALDPPREPSEYDLPEYDYSPDPVEPPAAPEA